MEIIITSEYDKGTMRKSIVISLLVVYIAMIIVVGCTSPGSSPAPVATPTPQIVYVTVLVTPTPQVQDPIIGVWRDYNKYNDKEADHRIEFNANLTFTEYYYVTPNFDIFTGTWYKNGDNTYTARFSDGGNAGDYVYSPEDNIIEDEYSKFNRYTGSVIPATTPTKQPTSVQSPPKSFTMSGSGDDIKPFSVTSGGGFIITGTNSGKSNFIVHISDTGGNVVEYLFNEIGPYSGRKIISLDAGKYYLEVRAEGSWSVTLTPS